MGTNMCACAAKNHPDNHPHSCDDNVSGAVANHIGKQKRHVTSNAYDINKPLGEALAAPHKANKINQIGEKKAGKS